MNVEFAQNTAVGRFVKTEVLGMLRRVFLPHVRLRVSERRLLLMLIDLLIVSVALVVAVAIWTDFPVSGRTLLLNWRWFLTLSVEWLLCAAFFDCYDLARAASKWHSLVRAGPAALATAAVYTLTPVYTPSLQSRGLLFTFAGGAVVGMVAWRAAYAQLLVQPWFKQRALVVGAGWAGQELVSTLNDAHEDSPNPFLGTGYEIVAFVDDNADFHGTRVADVPVLGGGDQLVRLARELEVDEVILAITHRHAINEGLFDALLRCRELGYRVTTMSMLYERVLGRVPVDHIGRDLHVIIRMEETPGERLYHAVKRTFDLLLALCGLTGVAIMAPLIALVNAFTSPGPLFYRQERVGRAGETFQMLKFRTMAPDAEPDGHAVWASYRDERITPAGQLLRRTRLDELPQCWNVLLGHMSIIGPRPERPEFVGELAEKLPFYRARHAVRPGITGWAQVRFEYGNSVGDAQVKLEHDLYYVKHAGLLIDLRIFLQTVLVMLEMKGL